MMCKLEEFTADSEGIPVWGSPVSHEEAMEAFCKVARYWIDHERMTDIRCKAEAPILTIGDYISHGIEWLWCFVVCPDEEQTLNIKRNDQA